MCGGSNLYCVTAVHTLLKTDEKKQSTDAVYGNFLNCALMLEKLVGFQSSWHLTFCELFGCFAVFRFQKRYVRCRSSALFRGTCESSNGCCPGAFSMCLHRAVLNEVGPRDSRAALAPCSASANQPISLKRRLQSCVYTLSRTGGVWLHFSI